MPGLIILRALPIAAITNVSGNGQSFLLTPDPKEVWDAGIVGTNRHDIDLGSVQQFDTVFLGYSNAAAGATWRGAYDIVGGGTGTVFAETAMRVPGGLGPRYHSLALLPAPITAQTLRIHLTQPVGSAPLQAGVLMIGKRFEHAYEFKSGRKPIDLSERVDLASGGFGFGRGAIKSSFRFTFSDLTDAELETLWNEIMALGLQYPVLMVEGGDAALSHNQVHYGVFERFEPYERDDPSDTRWALSMTDWV
jgi:hypothetical protein